MTLVGDKLAKTNQQCQVSTQLRDEVMLKEISRAVAGACTRENEKIDSIDQRENSILVRKSKAVSKSGQNYSKMIEIQTSGI